eukprot:scaffold91144_cov67-Phaeocystis_antarctica.AAC.8
MRGALWGAREGCHRGGAGAAAWVGLGLVYGIQICRAHVQALVSISAEMHFGYSGEYLSRGTHGARSRSRRSTLCR